MKTLALVALLSSAFSIAFLSHGSADCPFSDPPVELGAVEWQRDLDAAREQSQATGKPVLVLFQEVPG